jgi:hypothetical protein
MPGPSLGVQAVADEKSNVLRLAADLLRRRMAITDEKPPARSHQLDVLQSMTELMDSLPTQDSKREVLAFLAASLGVTIKEPSATRPSSGYGYRAKRRS